MCCRTGLDPGDEVGGIVWGGGRDLCLWPYSVCLAEREGLASASLRVAVA